LKEGREGGREGGRGEGADEWEEDEEGKWCRQKARVERSVAMKEGRESGREGGRECTNVHHRALFPGGQAAADGEDDAHHLA
jgi:hypothetical protein